MIGKADLCQELYVLDDNKFKKHDRVSNVNNVSLDVWHSRLGDPSMQSLFRIRDHLSIKTIKQDFFSHCNVSPLAKQKQLPFVSMNLLQKDCFTLIHCDIWGPYHILSYQGFRYFATIVDDYSRYTWVYMLKNKSELFKSFLHFSKWLSLNLQRKSRFSDLTMLRNLNLKIFFVCSQWTNSSEVLCCQTSTKLYC